MFTQIQSAIKKRIFIVLLMVHLGLGLGIYALARASFPNGWDLTSSIFLGAIFCLYGGFCLGILFVLLPLLPWLNKAQRVEHWTERLVRDLPFLLEQLPKLISAFQSLVALWNAAKAGANPSQDPAHRPPEGPKTTSNLP